MKKEVSVATVAKRMGRILTAYKEQVAENDAPTVQTTSSFGEMVYSTNRGLELHKTLLTFATNDRSHSSDSDHSDELIESPPKRRRQPIRIEYPAIDIRALTERKRKKRIHSSTVTSTINTTSTTTTPSSKELTTNLTLEITGTEDTAKPIKTSSSFNENDNRQN